MAVTPQTICKWIWMKHIHVWSWIDPCDVSSSLIMVSLPSEEPATVISFDWSLTVRLYATQSPWEWPIRGLSGRECCLRASGAEWGLKGYKRYETTLVLSAAASPLLSLSLGILSFLALLLCLFLLSSSFFLCLSFTISLTFIPGLGSCSFLCHTFRFIRLVSSFKYICV